MRFCSLALLVLILLTLAACGSEGRSVEVTPNFGLRFEAEEVDNDGCPLAETETSQSGYAKNQLPSDITNLSFKVYAQDGTTVLAEANVVVNSTCDNPYDCVQPSSQGYKMFDIPTQQNMSLEVNAYNASNELIWLGKTYDIDISRDQDDPQARPLMVDVFMHRISRLTRAFNCMGVERFMHTATVLRDGMNVLIVGGVSQIRQGACPDDVLNGSNSNTCDLLIGTKLVTLYNGETGEFIEMNPINEKRAGHSAVLLKDGQVLIMGGADKLAMLHTGDGEAYIEASADNILASAVVYNPTGRGAVTGSPISMGTARMTFTVTPLDDDETHFLVAGGWGEAGKHTQLQIIDYVPGKNDKPTFRVLDHVLNAGRSGHTATRVNDGQVFIYGGAAAGEPVAEIFLSENAGVEVPDDLSSKWNSLPMLSHHAAGAFSNGKKVLVTGGLKRVASGDRQKISEENNVSMIFDLENRNTELLSDQEPRAFHTISPLPDGSLVIAGGMYGTKLTSERLTLDLLNDSTGKIASLKDNIGADVQLNKGRMGHTVSVLKDTSLVFIGGSYPDESDESFPTNKSFLKSSESYMPDPNYFPSSESSSSKAE